MNRKEGRKIKGGIPMDAVIPFIMPTRAAASNSFSATVDIDKCDQFLCSQRMNGMENLGIIHIYMAAYVRVVSQLPGINRYIRGQRIYARNGIEICMTIKKQLKLNAPETVVKINAAPDATLEMIYRQLDSEIVRNKQAGDNNSMDTAARVLVSLPGVMLRGTVNVLKFLDYFGCLPRFLTKLSPFHGSMFITNKGSLGMPPIYHHLYNFGNLPVFIAMGAKRTEHFINKKGETEKRRVIDFNIVCDERICDGHYYSAAFKKLRHILADPEQLLLPPKQVIEDIR